MVAPIGDIDVPIGVDGDIGRMIELARARIPFSFRGGCDVRAEVGYCIGILGLLDLSILAELHQEPTLWRELLDPMIIPVGDVYIAVLVERNSPRLVEMTVVLPGPAAFPDKLAVRSEDLQPVVAAVDNDDVVVFLYGQAGRAKQLTIAAAGLAPLPQEFAIAVKHGDRVPPVVRQVNILLGVDRNSERPSAMTVAVAVFAKVGEPFFFTGTANLSFIDVHPEVILIAPIGGIENAIFPKAHRLNIIETRATGCVAPDGMTPIIDASFRHRCERHSAPPL